MRRDDGRSSRCGARWSRWAGALAAGVGAAGALAQPVATDLCGQAPVVSEGRFATVFGAAANEVFGACDPQAALPDLWLDYVPSASGQAVLTTCGETSADTVLSVYDGSCAGAELACNDDFGVGCSGLGLHVTGGRHYLVRIAQVSPGGFDPDPGVRIELLPDCHAAAGAPANDCCGSATPIGPGVFTVNTVGATRDYADGCVLLHGSADVWYRFTAPATGTVALRPEATAPRMEFVVFEGGCGGTVLACVGDPGRGPQQVVLAVSAGQAYTLRVSRGDGFDPFTAQASLAYVNPPVNDDCASATDISGQGAFAFDNTLANNSGPDDAPACNAFRTSAIAQDVWFRWTATGLPAGKDVEVATCGGTFADTRIAVYDGAACPGPGAAPIACNDDFCFTQSRVVFTPVAGHAYFIRIGNYPGSVDPISPGGPGMFTVTAIDQCIVARPAGAIDEAEACGQDLNGGCGSATPAYQIVPCGTTTIYGTASSDADSTDDDWYSITLPVATTLSVEVHAEFPVRVDLTDDQCPANQVDGIFVRQACNDGLITSFSDPVSAGTYRVVVQNRSGNTPCGTRNHYALTISAGDCTPRGRCCAGSACTVVSQAACQGAGGSYAGDGSTCPPPGGNYQAAACGSAFEDISATGSPGPVCDDCGQVVPLGFAFTYFGQAFTQVAVSSNGYLTFNTDGFLGNAGNEPLPSVNALSVIAPWWDDFNTDPAADGAGGIYFQTLGAPGSRRFVAMWSGVQHYSAPGTASTFEAILFEGSNQIEFRYGPLDGGDSANVGVSNPDGTVGLDIPAGTQGTCQHLMLVVEPNPCGCRADFNHSGSVTVQDIFDFLGAYFTQSPAADINGVGGVTVQDIFDYLALYFTGC